MESPPPPLPQSRRPLTPASARNYALLNQLATPGLGSLLGGRWLAGSGQLILALAGFCLIIAWFVKVMLLFYQQIESNANPAPGSVAWLGESGAATFAVAWIWSLFTSLSLLREARKTPAPTA